MDQVVQQNASLVEEASAATEAMSAQARTLLELVSRFKLGDAREFVQPVGPAAVRMVEPPQPPSISARRRPPLPRGHAPAPALAGAAGGQWEEF
jgi:hypothetical protein